MQQRDKDKYRVYLTHDTLRGIMLEKARHPGVECILQMPGVRRGNIFYFDMAADSGIRATYRPGMCEKDHTYIDHLSTRIAEYYDFPAHQLTVSQIHYHPPGYARFSPGDGPANTSLARQFGGAVTGIFLVDPEFRMLFWYIDEQGRETPVDYIVDDEAVASAMPKKSIEKLRQEIEKREALALRFAESGTIRADSRARGPEIEKKTGFSDAPSGSGGAGKECAAMTRNSKKELEALSPYSVLIPDELRDSRYDGPLYGYYIEETKTFNIVTKDYAKTRKDTALIGEVHPAGAEVLWQESAEPWVRIMWTDADPTACVAGASDSEVEVSVYSLRKDLFSRNEGILESAQMADKQAVIAGAGSGGFSAGLALVKAGIGSVVIADDDILYHHNLCRHVCGIHDVGRYKVDLFRERAADINPHCKVYTFRSLLQHVDPAALEEVLWEKAVILSCADNRHAGYVCNELANLYHIPMVDAGCGPMASTGEVYYYKPDAGMACYTCAYGEDIGVDRSNQAVRRQFYATEQELEKLHFQPGMSMDIEVTAIFQTKLAIDLLMEGEEGYTPKLLPYVKQCTILLNYPVEKEANPYMPLFDGEERRPLTWKTGCAERNPNCSFCGGQ